jgi:hypothetical protein
MGSWMPVSGHSILGVSRLIIATLPRVNLAPFKRLQVRTRPLPLDDYGPSVRTFHKFAEHCASFVPAHYPRICSCSDFFISTVLRGRYVLRREAGRCHCVPQWVDMAGTILAVPSECCVHPVRVPVCASTGIWTSEPRVQRNFRR